MMVQQLVIGAICIDVIKKDIKNIHLAVYPPTGRVRIAAPLNTDEEAIRLFAVSKLSWIKRHQRNFENQERIPAREYRQRENHYFQGKRYLLNVIDFEGAPKVLIHSKKHIDLYISPNVTVEKKHKVIANWYRKELKKLIPGIISKWEKILNVEVKGWQIKQMKTKWGSCNIEEKKVWLNLELAKKPVSCLEYIIVHEMIHLLERHHNERFLYYMDTFLPSWKQTKVELNNLPVSHADWDY